LEQTSFASVLTTLGGFLTVGWWVASPSAPTSDGRSGVPLAREAFSGSAAGFCTDLFGEAFLPSWRHPGKCTTARVPQWVPLPYAPARTETRPVRPARGVVVS